MGTQTNTGPPPTPGSVRDTRRGVALIERGDVDKPMAPKHWALATIASWEAFWSSDLIEFVHGVDVPGLQRLFTYYDMWVKTYEKWMSDIERFGDGEILGVTMKNTAVVSPYIMQMDKLETMTLRLEERFGITPLVRARLGIRFAEATVAEGKAGKVKRKSREGVS